MKMHRVQHILITSVPALLTPWLALAAPAATNNTAADFPSVVPFELGEGEFQPGDSITIQRVTGTSPIIRTGETYCVEGAYTLASQEKADLAFFATTANTNSTPTDPSQIVRIGKGTGTFRLVKTMRDEGYLHLSFYPVPSGSWFGGIYFGQGKWVNRDRGWSHLDTHARARDYSGTGNPTGGQGSWNQAEFDRHLLESNRSLLEYLGDPVPPPADMSAAYSKDGLIKAVQTAARNAGTSVKRVEIDDSEFPFLIGVICKEGDWEKLKAQFRKMEGYEYGGSVGGKTHNAFNLVPYRVVPSGDFERVSHRTGLRMQILCDKITRLK